MDNTLDKINNFLNQFDELETLYHDVLKERSDIDKSLSSWYHVVEGTTIKHISKSHNLIKDVKIILDKRRDIKLNEILLRSLCDILRPHIIGVLKKHEAIKTKHVSLRKEMIERAK